MSKEYSPKPNLLLRNLIGAIRGELNMFSSHVRRL
jgi:hypothetical protein